MTPDYMLLLLVLGAGAFGVDAVILFGLADRAISKAVQKYLNIRAMSSLLACAVLSTVAVFASLLGGL